MFIRFFHALKRSGLPVTLREYLTLMQGLEAGVAERQVEDFYFLSRACLVKDERNLDRFDRVFGEVFKGIATLPDAVEAEIPEDWLRLVSELHLSEEDMKRIEELGGWEKIMETLKQRLEEQKERHAGGNKWIGTGGTSPFGAYGYNPAGCAHRAEGESAPARRQGLGQARIQRSRRGGRDRHAQHQGGAAEATLVRAHGGCRRARPLRHDPRHAEKGYLDIRMLPERHNAVKVLMFFDVGGSMDWHIKGAEELFSAAGSEFKHLEYYYFHNCIYEAVWKNNSRRRSDVTSTWDVLNTYPPDYKVIFVGDASMSPYELSHTGGAVEHMNEEPGALWLRRVAETWRHSVWLNPVREQLWGYTPSIAMIRDIMEGRMYPLTLEGLDRGMAELMR